MLLDLIVRELVYDKTIRKSCLSSLNLSKIIDDSSIWVLLLNVLIDKVDYLISIWKSDFLNIVWEDNLSFSWRIYRLYLSIFFALLHDIFIPKLIVFMVFFRVDNTPIRRRLNLFLSLFLWNFFSNLRFIICFIQILRFLKSHSACLTFSNFWFWSIFLSRVWFFL